VWKNDPKLVEAVHPFTMFYYALSLKGTLVRYLVYEIFSTVAAGAGGDIPLVIGVLLLLLRFSLFCCIKD
jgi:hypothetical protein